MIPLKSRFRAVIPLLTSFVLIFSCTANLNIQAVNKFENYHFKTETPLVSRIAAPPDFVLTYLKKLDNKTDYTPYLPTNDEIRIAGKSLQNLPYLNNSILKNRLIGIYFIDNFMGNGLCDWVLDRQGTVYFFIVINSRVFKKNITELLTEKERTCYKNDTPDIEIKIDCGKQFNGFQYIILHESTHAVDYVLNVTPYVDENFRKAKRISADETEFTKGIWTKSGDINGEYKFNHKVSFYGLSPQKLNVSDSQNIYMDLSRSPFITLYSTLAWPEDLAEMVTFYHLTHKLNQPFHILVYNKGKKIISLDPLEFTEVRKRLPFLRRFYEHLQP